MSIFGPAKRTVREIMAPLQGILDQLAARRLELLEEQKALVEALASNESEGFDADFYIARMQEVLGK
jgi:hypothetical protein